MQQYQLIETLPMRNQRLSHKLLPPAHPCATAVGYSLIIFSLDLLVRYAFLAQPVRQRESKDYAANRKKDAETVV